MGICCMSQGTQTGALYQPREVGWEGDGREVQEGGGICTSVPDSHCSLIESNNNNKKRKQQQLCKAIILQLRSK